MHLGQRDKNYTFSLEYTHNPLSNQRRRSVIKRKTLFLRNSCGFVEKGLTGLNIKIVKVITSYYKNICFGLAQQYGQFFDMFK